MQLVLAGVAQLVGSSPHNQQVAGSFPSQGPYLGCGSDSQTLVRVSAGNNQMMLLLTLMFLSPPSSPSKSNLKNSDWYGLVDWESPHKPKG